MYGVAGGAFLVVVTVEQQLHQLLRGGTVTYQQRFVLRLWEERGRGRVSVCTYVYVCVCVCVCAFIITQCTH